MRFLAVMLAGLLAAGCATTNLDVAIAPVLPQPVDLARGAQRAGSGDLILLQEVRVFEAARLDAPVSAMVLGDLFDTRAELAAGALLYRVMLRSRQSELAYCSIDVEENDINPDVRLCLADHDKDGRFDQVWRLAEPGETVSIGGGDVQVTAPPLNPSVPYSIVAADTIETMTIGILFRCYGSRCHFAIVESHDDGARHLGFVNFPIPSETRPVVVSVLGARIRVLSIDQQSVEYEILSPFPTDTPIAIVRYLPRTTYVYY